MCVNFLLSLVLVFFVTFISAKTEANPYLDALHIKQWESHHDYVEVRPGAHMFYWLYYADGTKLDAHKKPLIIWIQGGPGYAASGIGNFGEIGPLTMAMQPRDHTWVKGHNVLLIDHPVGTGFSYVVNDTLLVKSDKVAALDLVRLITTFFHKHKEFRKAPTYLFSQSYGGKLCPRVAYYLHTTISKKKLQINLKGIGIGGGFVNPKETYLVYPQVLYTMGLLDWQAYKTVVDLSFDVADFINKKDFWSASKAQKREVEVMRNATGMEINYDNINQPSTDASLYYLEQDINSYVKPTLKVNQSISWVCLADKVYTSLEDSFMTPSYEYLELLLNNTNLKIAVYNGNLDIVTPLAGASNWVHKLQWSGADDFKRMQKYPIAGFKNGFYKEYENLSFWWVYNAGHWIPEDNPEAMKHILEHMIVPDNSII